MLELDDFSDLHQLRLTDDEQKLLDKYRKLKKIAQFEDESTIVYGESAKNIQELISREYLYKLWLKQLVVKLDKVEFKAEEMAKPA